MSDAQIVRAAIYPAIGIARVGNSPDEFFIGPEVTTPQNRPAGFYKDAHGALKRQAARFRVYGLDANGKVVRELNAKNAKITWRVHVANRKAWWYEFDVALDIPQAQPVVLRNGNFTGKDREELVIDPGPRSISGANESGKKYQFDSGKFIGTTVYLGELRTDEQGRLLFLGGHGLSQTPFHDNPPTTFANNDGWCDDTSDGPVDAEVTFDGRKLECEGAWVITAPPNYAPDLISVQTMYDVIFDTLAGTYTTPATTPSFTHDIYPLLQQLSMSQWVNQGFYVGYGYGQAYDFQNPEWIRRLSTPGDAFTEYRRQVFNYFRPPNPTTINEQQWPWMYGDNMNVPVTTPNGYFSITGTLYTYLQSWVHRHLHGGLGSRTRPAGLDRRHLRSRAPGGRADEGRALVLPRRAVPSGLRDDLADAKPEHVQRPLPDPPPVGEQSRARVAAGAHARPLPEPGELDHPVVDGLERPGRHHALDGGAVAGGYSQLPRGIRHQVRPADPDVLAGACPQHRAHPARLQHRHG